VAQQFLDRGRQQLRVLQPRSRAARVGQQPDHAITDVGGYAVPGESSRQMVFAMAASDRSAEHTRK